MREMTVTTNESPDAAKIRYLSPKKESNLCIKIISEHEQWENVLFKWTEWKADDFRHRIFCQANH